MERKPSYRNGVILAGELKIRIKLYSLALNRDNFGHKMIWDFIM
jgi:hypothetical protein